MDRSAASTLRQRLRVLREERRRLEDDLLLPGRLLRGSLIARLLGSGKARRATPAYYLSVPGETPGRPRLLYVRQDDLERVRRDVEAYRRFRRTLRRLRVLGREIQAALEALGRSQETEPPR
jgi:hypothetical protein